MCLLFHFNFLGDDLVDATSPEVQTSVDDVKRIRVSGPKPGRLYPALSDIESPDTDETRTEYAAARSTSPSDEGEYKFHDNRQKFGQQCYDEDGDRYGRVLTLFLFCCCVD